MSIGTDVKAAAAEERTQVDDIALFCLFALNDFRSAAQRVRRHIMLCLSMFKSFGFVLMRLTRKSSIGMDATKHRRKTKWPYMHSKCQVARDQWQTANRTPQTITNSKRIYIFSVGISFVVDSFCLVLL